MLNAAEFLSCTQEADFTNNCTKEANFTNDLYLLNTSTIVSCQKEIVIGFSGRGSWTWESQKERASPPARLLRAFVYHSFNASFTQPSKLFIDFSFPYGELDVPKANSRRAGLEQAPAGRSIVIIVPTKPDSQKDLWIFAKPLSWCLWLTMGIACIVLGLVLVHLERRVNNAEFGGALHDKLFMLLWFPFALLVFQERRMANKWSKVVVFIWLCMVFIVIQCYVTKLVSILTEDQWPRFFPNQYNNIGYRDGSSVKKILMEEFGFSESQLKSYSNFEEYHLALSKGSHNGGVDAIFDNLLYADLFMNKYGSQYAKIGPISKAVGFGFAFPTGSHYHFNFPIKSLNVDESSKVGELRKKLDQQYHHLYQQTPSISTQSQSLTAYNFGGIFIITGISILLVIICSEYSIWRNCIDSLPSNSIESSTVHSTFEMIEVNGDFNTTEAQQDTSSSPTNEEVSTNQEESEAEEFGDVVHL